MSELKSARHKYALDQVSQALAMLEKVRIRWHRYADTTQFARATEPVEIFLRSVKNALMAPGHARLRDTLETLPRVIMAMRIIKRDELDPVIEKTQAAYDAGTSDAEPRIGRD